MLLCEAAGFENMLVETVGVGQSETAVRSMTDFFLLLMLAGAGDDLQGIKRGIIEMVDAMAVTKADGDNIGRAERARAEYRAALHLFPASADGWVPRVLTCSALTGEGVVDVWNVVLEHQRELTASGALASRRSSQALEWMRRAHHQRTRGTAPAGSGGDEPIDAGSKPPCALARRPHSRQHAGSWRRSTHGRARHE